MTVTRTASGAAAIPAGATAYTARCWRSASARPSSSSAGGRRSSTTRRTPATVWRIRSRRTRARSARSLSAASAGQAVELEREAGEFGPHAVVQVAAQPASLLLPGGDQGFPAALQLRDERRGLHRAPACRATSVSADSSSGRNRSPLWRRPTRSVATCRPCTVTGTSTVPATLRPDSTGGSPGSSGRTSAKGSSRVLPRWATSMAGLPAAAGAASDIRARDIRADMIFSLRAPARHRGQQDHGACGAVPGTRG